MTVRNFVANQMGIEYAEELCEKLEMLKEMDEEIYKEECERFKNNMDDSTTDCDDDDSDDSNMNEHNFRRMRNFIIAFTRAAKRVEDGKCPSDLFYSRHKTNELIRWLMDILKRIERERYAEKDWELVDEWER